MTPCSMNQQQLLQEPKLKQKNSYIEKQQYSKTVADLNVNNIWNFKMYTAVTKYPMPPKRDAPIQTVITTTYQI